jgi:hypothetical protein
VYSLSVKVEMNLLSLINSWLNKFCQITTKVLQEYFFKIFRIWTQPNFTNLLIQMLDVLLSCNARSIFISVFFYQVIDADAPRGFIFGSTLYQFHGYAHYRTWQINTSESLRWSLGWPGPSTMALSDCKSLCYGLCLDIRWYGKWIFIGNTS